MPIILHHLVDIRKDGEEGYGLDNPSVAEEEDLQFGQRLVLWLGQ